MIYSRRLGTALVELTAWAAGRRRRYRVEGDSMLPTLVDGDFVLLDPEGAPRPGEVVVLNHPSQPRLIIKRLERAEPDGSLYVLGDNAESGTDSRTFGALDPGRVVGVVRLSLSRPGGRMDRREPFDR